jgi:hypothetical protein
MKGKYRGIFGGVDRKVGGGGTSQQIIHLKNMIKYTRR